MLLHDVEIPERAIAQFCRHHHIQRLAVFGSLLRPEFGPDSDVDFLVEFEPGFAPALNFFEMEEELSSLVGRKVDLHTPGFLSRYFRSQVQSTAKEIYAAGR